MKTVRTIRTLRSILQITEPCRKEWRASIKRCHTIGKMRSPTMCWHCESVRPLTLSARKRRVKGPQPITTARLTDVSQRGWVRWGGVKQRELSSSHYIGLITTALYSGMYGCIRLVFRSDRRPTYGSEFSLYEHATLNRQNRNTDMRRLTTGIRSEKCVVSRFRRCVNVIECTYTNLDSTV